MVDATTIILTAVFTGIGISMGNALYDVFLKDYFVKMKRTKKKISLKMKEIKIPWLAALLNFVFWGVGYLYVKKKRVLAVVLLIVEFFIVGNLTASAAAIEGGFEVLNYSFLTLLVSGYLAYDAYKLAREG